MENRIIVAGRIRPLSPREIAENDDIILEHDDKNNLYIAGMYSNKKFKLDKVLPAMSNQDDVFQTVSPLLKSALEGINCTVFAYGQTGTGKLLCACILFYCASSSICINRENSYNVGL
jgi:kinesin family protein 11